ncbi:MAG: MFS transporter [Simkania sp.]|nr:MFS transporter [Simkania sp.]
MSKRILAVIGIGLGVVVLGMIWSIVNTALATIQKDLSATVLELQWMMNCFGIFLCIPLLTMGKLGDAYGRRKLFLYGLIGALAASTIAGFSTQVTTLIGCMGLFGLAGSIILPLSQALLVHQFPEAEKGKAVALWSTFASLSLACGPLVGGVILNWLGWRWIYWINVPVVLFTIPLVFFFVKNEKEHHKPHCDWAGVGLLALVVGSLIIGIMQGPTWGWASYPILALFVLCLLSLLLFIILERKTTTPLFRPDLFSHRSFLFSSIPNGCTIGFIWTVFFIIPLYLQNIQQLTPLTTSIILLLITLPVAFLSVPISKLYRKIGAKPLIVTGLFFFIIAFLLQSLFTPSFWTIGLGCLAVGLGWVLAWGPSISCALSSIPHKLAGVASGMFTTLQELGAIISLAIAGALFRSTNAQVLAPDLSHIHSALSSNSPDQIQSLLTNPSAVEAQLGPNSPIIPVLREAFLAGYQNTFWFLFAVGLFAILITCFLPKQSKVK